MQLGAIFAAIEKIGCLTFTTLDTASGPPQIHSRIAHFLAGDDEGLYFMTMAVKPFYRQLVDSKKLSVCGIYPSGRKTGKDRNGMPLFEPGFTLRITGDVRELAFETVQAKADAGNAGMQFALYDMARYPAIRIFCLHCGKGEIYDYDFEKDHRHHKLLRTRFAFGGERFNRSGVRISDACTSCGRCVETCTFDAIAPGEPYQVISERCDECGNCILSCPENAICESKTI
ncbi:MAG: 4Fe-4S binding protein [Desulfosarcinaceae bacterium]|nr:4Fe-4S binding protein [Desulfosarcinaceae bacterium]